MSEYSGTHVANIDTLAPFKSLDPPLDIAKIVETDQPLNIIIQTHAVGITL